MVPTRRLHLSGHSFPHAGQWFVVVASRGAPRDIAMSGRGDPPRSIGAKPSRAAQALHHAITLSGGRRNRERAESALPGVSTDQSTSCVSSN
ncbi:hypothetical protein [Lysobacter gummosus]|uniref:hypothetical protein n=1 Tax=Lysobacter gummosus TaxID=262324 RepID=UPI00363E168B